MNNTLNDVKYTDTSAVAANQKNTVLAPSFGAEYDYVLSFFKSVVKDESAAEQFTQSLYDISAATKKPVMELLEPMRSKNEIDINEIMAYYINGTRSPSTLLGVQRAIVPNYYAGRNVLS